MITRRIESASFMSSSYFYQLTDTEWNWRSISEDSLRRYVEFASESCIQELLAASVPQNAAGYNWKVLTADDGVEISKRRCGSLHIFRSRWELRSVSAQQFIVVANAIDAAKVLSSLLPYPNRLIDLRQHDRFECFNPQNFQQNEI